MKKIIYIIIGSLLSVSYAIENSDLLSKTNNDEVSVIKNVELNKESNTKKNIITHEDKVIYTYVIDMQNTIDHLSVYKYMTNDLSNVNSIKKIQNIMTNNWDFPDEYLKTTKFIKSKKNIENTECYYNNGMIIKMNHYGKSIYSQSCPI